MPLSDYSDINEVQRLATKYKIGKVMPSTRKDKKYMVQAPLGSMVHFGQMGYEDYTKSKDKERRRQFRLRNAKWAEAPRFTPAWLSYYLLW